MLLVPCPYCGIRPEIEFHYAGEAHIDRPVDPGALSDEALASYLYLRSNNKGLQAERWYHLHGCGRFFNAIRDTTTDRFSDTYPSGAKRSDISNSGRAIDA